MANTKKGAKKKAAKSKSNAAAKSAVKQTAANKSARPSVRMIDDVKTNNTSSDEKVKELNDHIEAAKQQKTAKKTKKRSAGQIAESQKVKKSAAESAPKKAVSQKSVPKQSAEKQTSDDKKQVNKVVRILRWPLLLAELAASSILVFAVIRLNVLQVWQVAVIGAVLALLFLFNAFKLFRKKTHGFVRVLCLLFSLIITGACAFAFKNLQETIAFLEHATAAQTRTISYSVMVEKASDADDIKDIENQKLGFISVDQYKDESKARLLETIRYEAVDTDALGTMMADLEDGNTNAIVLSRSYVDLINENNKDFADQLKIIYTFEITVEDGSDEAKVDTASEPFTVLISGSDSRNGISATARSDVNIVAAIDPKEGKILLVAIPRDYYVQLHGTTGIKDKLTHAGVYGIDMSRDTIADLLGVKIDHTVKVSFDTVINIVDAIDGIDIYSDTAFTAHTDSSCHFTVGNQHVSSKCALAFSRERYSYATGDRHRGENQEAVIAAIFNKVMSPKYLVRYTDLLSAIDGSFETSLSYDEITNFAKAQLASMKSWSIENYNLDGTGSMQPTYSMGSRPLYVMIPNQATVETAVHKIKTLLGEETDAVETETKKTTGEDVPEEFQGF